MEKMDKRKIAILGPTGSMGVQALEVIEQFRDFLEVEVLAALNSADLLIEQAKKFQPNTVVIVNDAHYTKVKEALWDDDIKVFAGMESLCDVMEMSSIEMVLSCIVGVAGLAPVYRAIENKKIIALANKETLVVAGELMMQKAKEMNVPILPVDSEHSAIFQSLVGENLNPIEKLILTASGGPFRGKEYEFIKQVTPAQALKHPNWDMGTKITIDFASMMNKGFEVIEPKWLFGLKPEQIEVVVHPQSIIHSMVQFEDGAVKAQLGVPDMRVPIQYAFSYPDRLLSSFDRLDFSTCGNLTFEKPDTTRFRNLALAYEALHQAGNMPCIVNAANEIAVAAFLNEKIGFQDIPKIIERAMQNMWFMAEPTYNDYVATDNETRAMAQSFKN